MNDSSRKNAKKNYKVVYTIVQRARDGRKFWLRIGAAFENRDGSLNVYMDAMPTNGQLQIRDWQPHEERARGAANDNADDGDEQLPASVAAAG